MLRGERCLTSTSAGIFYRTSDDRFLIHQEVSGFCGCHRLFCEGYAVMTGYEDDVCAKNDNLINLADGNS
jgi:hypothetical protein